MGTLIDMTGQKIGRLTVLERDNTKPRGRGRKAHWICRCDCGNIVSVDGTNLRQGNTKSCGCLQKETVSNFRKKDITGKQFGFLVARYSTGRKDNNGSYIWHCDCLNCGGSKDVSIQCLNKGGTRSCGCLSTSFGELRVKKILEDNEINFVQQYKFEDCLSDKGYKLKFDFAIFKGTQLYCLLEIQGIQHKQLNSKFDNKESFTDRQLRDNIKQQYCITHNIPLIEIPYEDVDKIDWEYLKEKCNL